MGAVGPYTNGDCKSVLSLNIFLKNWPNTFLHTWALLKRNSWGWGEGMLTLAPQVTVNAYVVNSLKYCAFLSLMGLSGLSRFCFLTHFHLKHVLKQILTDLYYVVLHSLLFVLTELLMEVLTLWRCAVHLEVSRAKPGSFSMAVSS